VPAVAAHRATIIEQFTPQAPAYAAAAINDAAQPQLLVAASGVGPADRALEVACGRGTVTCAFAAAARSAVGLDLGDASPADDRLGVGARCAGDRIQYAYPLAVLVSRRTAAGV
jgi:ubiquinone/menaquinone biosynthesis C-methylase UbiE